MRFQETLTGSLTRSRDWKLLEEACRDGGLPCLLSGIPEGMKALAAQMLCEALGRPVLLVCASDEAALRKAQDLSALTGDAVSSMPPRPLTLFRSDALGRDITYRRIEILGRTSSAGPYVQPVSIDSLMAPLSPPEDFRSACIRLERGSQVDRDDLAARLVWAGYTREERAEAPGQFAVRGGLMDVYPVAGAEPVRMEFFGDEIDTLRSYDPVTQRSTGELDEAVFLPAQEMPLSEKALERGCERLLEEGKKAADLLRRRSAGKPSGAPAGFLSASQESPAKRVTDLAVSLRDELLSAGYFPGMEAYADCFYEKRWTLADYMKDPLIILDEPIRIRERSQNLALEYQQTYTDALEAGRTLPAARDLIEAWEPFLLHLGMDRCAAFQTILTGTSFEPKTLVRMMGIDTASFRGQFEILRNDIQRWKKDGWRVLLLSGGSRRGQHLSESLREYGLNVPCLEEDRPLSEGEIVILPLSTVQGFQIPEEKLAVVSERELFGAARTQGRRRKAV